MKRLAVVINFEKEIAKFQQRFNYVFTHIPDAVDWSYYQFGELDNPAVAAEIEAMDGILLTGAYNMLSDPATKEKYKNVITLIQKATQPILGICFGHQLIGVAFGFGVQPIQNPDPEIENEKALTLEFDPPFDLFPAKKIAVYETHHQEIRFTPQFTEVFEIYASSPTTKIQAIKHRRRPVYGVQFHPENPTNPRALTDGLQLVSQFVQRL